MNSDTIISLLLQIPLAGVVVYVVWLFLNYMRELTAQMMAFIKSQEEENRRFLTEQRNASNATIGRLADEIAATRQDVRELRGIVLGSNQEMP